MQGVSAMKQLLIGCLLLFGSNSFVLAEEHDATVTTNSGSYTVPVEVEDGAVTYVYWPNGGNMNVYGAAIEDGQASGYNSRGESVDIELDDYEGNEE